MHASWDEFVRNAAGSHGVCFYGGDEELVASVTSYLARGLDLGEPALVIATPEHAGAFRQGLGARGWEPGALEADRMLVIADAEATLAAITLDGAPRAELFDVVVGGLLDEAAAAAPRLHVRAFGEMVDLLCAAGARDEAQQLEELWNRAARRHNFSLLCAYHVDIFDPELQAQTLPRVCDAHGAVFPANHYARLARSVERALDEVIGPDEAGRIYLRLARRASDGPVPIAQLLLMWVSANMPRTAERVLAIARTHYLAPAES